MRTSSNYSKRPNLVLGFHGCDISVRDAVLNHRSELIVSQNDYDWLGSGIYFWENNLQRAYQYAKEAMTRPGSSIETPAVLGAVIDLGYCFDLMDAEFLPELATSYDGLCAIFEKAGKTMPVNKGIRNSKDLLFRNLDCAVIKFCHARRSEAGLQSYDSVRGVFWEGKDIYPGAGFAEKNHIQLCIRNLNCIKGYFLPRDIIHDYPIP